MSQTTETGSNRLRKNALDALLFLVATAVSVLAILELGPLGLAVGSVLLSVAAVVVVRRESESHEPADQPTTEDRVAADGGPRGD